MASSTVPAFYLVSCVLLAGLSTSTSRLGWGTKPSFL